MPTSKELVVNRPLRGTELAKIVMADVASMLAKDTMLANHIAYGRITYSVRLTLHLDAQQPYVATAVSRAPSDNQAEADPSLLSIATGPTLPDPSKDAYLSSVERTREIQSPNMARIEHGLPVTILAQGEHGHAVEKEVVYPPEAVEGISPQPTDVDMTAIARADGFK